MKLDIQPQWHPEFFILAPVILYICWILFKIYENTK